MTDTPTFPLQLSYEDALLGLKRAVAEKGEDYVYVRLEAEDETAGACAYFAPRTGSPSCIVGNVMSQFGVTYDDISAYNYSASEALFREHGVLAGDERTETLINYTQDLQDTEVPWGEAVSRATGYVEWLERHPGGHECSGECCRDLGF